MATRKRIENSLQSLGLNVLERAAFGPSRQQFAPRNPHRIAMGDARGFFKMAANERREAAKLQKAGRKGEARAMLITAQETKKVAQRHFDFAIKRNDLLQYKPGVKMTPGGDAITRSPKGVIVNRVTRKPFQKRKV